MSFSERMKVVPERTIQVNSIDDRLRNRLFNYFNSIFDEYDNFYREDIAKYISDKMGIAYRNYWDNCRKITDMILKSREWYVPYDIIEYALEYIYDNSNSYYNTNERYDYLVENLNCLLSEEKSCYRIIDKEFVPIIDEEELKEIQLATHSAFDAVDSHIKKAVMLYSDRNNPDYENSIKESISAVESMCCIITGMNGGNATLGNAIKKLEENGVVIHNAMQIAFRQLYGYTSDQNGIRHGGIDFVNAPEEDARYMLVSCSAFVNYLKDKYSKSQKDI